LAFVAVISLLAASLHGVAAGAEQDPLRWRPCPPELAAPDLRCATLQVPLDHRKPNGRKIAIEVSRLASTEPAKRRGVLLTNPGGPGAGYLEFPHVLKQSGLPQSVLAAYDIVTFDPRGVGRSTPVTCDLTPEQLKYGNHPPYAKDPADVAKRAQIAKAIAERCAASSTAWMLPHNTTANTARDMDLLRQALGEQKISYLGYSYGTYLGAVYTTLFPQHSDRFVLDSNLVPTGFDTTAVRLMARGLEDRFPDFATFAAAHPEYGLGATPRQVRAKFFEMAARLERKPSQRIDGSLFRWLTLSFLYNDALLPLLAESWQALDTGGALPDAVVAELDQPFGEVIPSNLAVICADSRWPQSVRTYQLDVEADRARYPMIGASTANIRPCAFWPADPVEPPVDITDRGPSNVLLAQYTRDPGTPLAGAERMRQALGDRARMVTAEGGGHGVYLFGTNTCANETVTRFLTTGRRPARDVTCT
jgi:pimeloyl-ACP methyl ester carboxylesterase